MRNLRWALFAVLAFAGIVLAACAPATTPTAEPEGTETEEVAISDSWSSAYDERWMTYEEAEAISQQALRVVKW